MKELKVPFQRMDRRVLTMKRHRRFCLLMIIREKAALIWQLQRSLCFVTDMILNVKSLVHIALKTFVCIAKMPS